MDFASKFIFGSFLVGLVIGEPLVQLPKGTIKGKTLTTPTEGKQFHTFLGIPYAKPPLGTLRFQPPVEVDSWSGILDATKDSNICYATTYDKPSENEDCLYLNVFTPALELGNTSKKLPVMFSIYGGSFRSGSDTYGRGGPEWYLEQEIIYVAFNYRIGPFGFLSTGDLTLPGNAGLKDQNLALRWTYENIHLFGGDRDQITLTGQSAGGASVTFHLLSKKSQGLYRAALTESGSSICPWAYISDPKSYVQNLAQKLNGAAYPSTNSSDLLQYLQSVDAKTIDTISSKMSLTLPVIEPEHDDAFLTEAMYELLDSGKTAKVPLLTGINSEEYISLAKNIPGLQQTAANYDGNHENLIPKDLAAHLSPENKTKVANIIKNVYVGDSTFSNNLGKVVAYSSDVMFNKANIRFGELQAKFSDVYFYQFSYKGKMGNVDVSIEGADNVAHGEESHYIYVNRGNPFDNTKFENFPENDITTHSRLIRLFTNFIKYSNPTPDPSDELLQNVTWPKVSSDSFSYLNINNSLIIQDTPKGERYAMWRMLYETYGVRPFVTF